MKPALSVTLLDSQPPSVASLPRRMDRFPHPVEPGATFVTSFPLTFSASNPVSVTLAADVDKSDQWIGSVCVWRTASNSIDCVFSTEANVFCSHLLLTRDSTAKEIFNELALQLARQIVPLGSLYNAHLLRVILSSAPINLRSDDGVEQRAGEPAYLSKTFLLVDSSVQESLSAEMFGSESAIALLQCKPMFEFTYH